MKKGSRSAAVGALLLSLAVLVGGCGGAKEQGSEQTKPAAAQGGGGTGPTGGKSESDKPASGTYRIVGAESKAGYEVKEVFLVESLNAIAVGTTSAITGDLVLENGAFKPSTVVVDVTTLKSDKQMRDNQLKRMGLETDTYKTAEFTVGGVEGSSVSLVDGQEVAFKLTGTAKVHGVEKPFTWDATARAEGEKLYLNATAEFKMELFEIQPPNILGKIRVDDGVKLNVNLVAQKG